MANKLALVTGITGQDGSFLAEHLLAKDYDVIGMKRRSSTDNNSNIKVLDHENFKLIEGDLTDSWCINRIIEKYEPDEVYNLAAQSHVGTSFQQPNYTFQVNTLGVQNLLEAIKTHCPSTRFLQASTSEMFGSNYDLDLDTGIKYQDENTSFHPRSPYAISKTASHHLVSHYREAYDLFAVASICFNHESERRGELFVSRKITKWIGDFVKWLKKHSFSPTELINDKEELYIPGRVDKSQDFQFPKLRLGNIYAQRDWGYARDYVRGMFLMLQNKEPVDYVISTNETKTVKDFIKVAFSYVGIENYMDYIVIDSEFYRPSDVEYLNGRSDLIRRDLCWEPYVPFDEMVQIMLKYDGAL